MTAPKKLCCDCRNLKPYYNFGYSPKNRDGLVSFCNDCMAIRANDYQATVRGRAFFLIGSCRRRSVRAGTIFALDGCVDEIEKMIEKGCALTGLAFDLTRCEGNKARGPSIDRIRPHEGYVPGNVRVICRALNMFLGEWGEDEVAPIAEAFLKNRK